MFNRKGQNIAEYSILIALVIAAAVAMQVYVKRGIQGRVADATDAKPQSTQLVAGAANLEFTTNQYEPYYLESTGNVASNRTFNEVISENAAISRTGINEQTVRYENAEDKTTYLGNNYDASVDD